MQNRLREIRKARGLTLAEVAARCQPPTTQVTVGRLETGMRSLTTGWMDRLARALDVEPRDLLASKTDAAVDVAAVLAAEGPEALTQPLSLRPPHPPAGTIALIVRHSQGDYRAGDQLWLEQLPPDRFAEAVNTDILVPRPVGRFAFGRLATVSGTRLQLLPLKPGSRQSVLSDPPWIARVTMLIRPL